LVDYREYLHSMSHDTEHQGNRSASDTTPHGPEIK
jgi:hypothetical protein